MSLDGPTVVTRSDYRQGPAKSAHFYRGRRAPPLSLTQNPDEHRPDRPVLLRVYEELREGTALRVAPELTDPFGPVEVGRHEDVEELGAKPKPPGPEKLLLRQQVTGTSRIDDVMRLKDGFAGCQVDHQHTREIERNLSDDHQDHRAVRHDTHQVDTDVLESDSVVSSRSDEIENGLKRVPVVPPVGPGTSGS